MRLFNSGSGTDYSDRSVPKIKGMEKTQPEPEKVPLQTKPATVRIFNPGTGTDYSDRLVPKIEEMEKTQPELEKVPQVGVSQARPKHAGPIRPLGIEQGTIFFRLFIWRDMIKQLSDKKPVFGFDFGRPFRSRNLAILNWGQSECRKDGWIAAHNSYLEIVYRAGIVGILFILGIFTAVAILTKEFLQRKSVTGILLCGALISWLAMANFLVILELPYNAIPFWSLFGMTFAYSRHL